MNNPQNRRFLNHRSANLVLSLIAGGIGLYLAISPLAPNLFFYVKHRNGSASAPYGGGLEAALNNQTTAKEPDNLPETNQLVIPSIFLNEPILEGDTIATADAGPWRRPTSSNPEGGSNTVIVGHRWTYRAARDIFFHLDKVKVDDPVAIYWNKKEYVYKVTNIRIAQPHEISVEAPTETPTLTLYTCTPVWSSSQRLVVTAELQETNE